MREELLNRLQTATNTKELYTLVEARANNTIKQKEELAACGCVIE
jgi:hypothetical protein